MSGAARRDAMRAVIVAAALALLFVSTEIFEWWYEITRPHEAWELDEVLGLAVAILLAALWFAWRRVQELRSQLHSRAEAEAELRENIEQITTVLDYAPIEIYVKDLAGHNIFANRCAIELLAPEAGTLRGRTAHEIFPQHEAELYRRQDQAVVETGKANHWEYDLPFQGSLHHFFAIKFPIFNGAGKIVQIGTIVSDISERKRAEAQDRISQARLQAILDYSPLALYLTDIEGRLLLVNRRFEQWFGIQNEAAIGKRLTDLFGAEDSHSLEQLEQEVLRSGVVRQSEATKLLTDGTQRTTMIAKFPVFDGHGGVLGTGSAEIDITDLKSAQRALQDAKEEADRANTAKSRFLAAASHDLRQPLHALNLLIEALDGETDESSRESVVSAMRQATSSMGEMLNALLDISQLDAGAIHPEPQDFRIGPFLEEMARAAAGRAAAKGIELRFVPSKAVVRSDRTLLGRIVENLLTNAVRYTTEGKILLGCRRRGERLRIEVHDSGIGIPSEHLSRIFEEYVQLGNQARDRSKGLGLGLAIVERLSRILDHPVTVHSHPGKGSCFAVEVALGQLGEHEAGLGDDVLDGTRMSGHGVLLLEDDSLVMEWTQRLLRSWGMTVWTANSVAEIQRCIQDAGDDIGLIIADLRLPGGESGLDLIRYARDALGVPVPAIITTGDTSPELPRHCAEADCSLLHKPIAPAKLRSLVRWLLSGHRVP